MSNHCCEKETAIIISGEHGDIFDILVDATRAQYIERLLRERNIFFDVLGSETNVNRANKPKPKIQSILKVPKPSFDWKEYYPLQAIYTWMQSLEKLYPSTCTVNSIGKTVEGREILMLKISNSDAGNVGVWLDGGIHAREWISVSVVTYIANYLANNYTRQPEFITNKDWHIVPVLNPDGYHYSFTSDRMWRKSRSRNGKDIVGVDLNRNFAANWSSQKDSYQDDPNHKNYRGPAPFSEPETTAVKDVILYTGTIFKIFVTFHSHSEVVAFPWCTNANPCPDYIKLLEGGVIMAKAIYETTGRVYKVGNFRDIMYTATGTSVDWSYGMAKIPFSYIIELRSKEHKFLLPKEEIIDCSRESLSAILALSEFADKGNKPNGTSVAIGKKRYQMRSPSINS